MSSKKSRPVEELEAALFFFKWSRTALETYAKTIKINYLKKLIEHCTRTRIDDDANILNYNGISSDPKNLIDDSKDAKKRLEAAKKRMGTSQIPDSDEDDYFKPNKIVSLVELACLYRIKALLKMCEELTKLMARMATWLDENRSLLRKFANLISILPDCRRIFESVCGVGEVFRLLSIDWTKCDQSKFLVPSKDDYTSEENYELVIVDAKNYCPHLITKINYFRTLIYTIGCSFTAMLETIFLKVAYERCEIRSKQINEILKNLPPQFLYAENYRKLSRRTMKLLECPPKNDHSFPMISSIRNDTKTKSSSKKQKAPIATKSEKYQSR
ncbi:unnamed protein product [Caenorhabditis bovis]|uniref:Uncharacterized protein n=1 Tax=Caenorhabditis bovis TaxID=2654633 RepID=A0A8S1FAZ7_9PELO|nr:unnamed protein product [Caenorhabditis bovis]